MSGTLRESLSGQMLPAPWRREGERPEPLLQCRGSDVRVFGGKLAFSGFSVMVLGPTLVFPPVPAARPTPRRPLTTTCGCSYASPSA